MFSGVARDALIPSKCDENSPKQKKPRNFRPEAVNFHKKLIDETQDAQYFQGLK